jgi:hypothetical protein
MVNKHYMYLTIYNWQIYLITLCAIKYFEASSHVRWFTPNHLTRLLAWKYFIELLAVKALNYAALYTCSSTDTPWRWS